MDKLRLKILEIVYSSMEDKWAQDGEPQKLESDTDLLKAGMDSIKFIYIVVALEEAFEIEIPDEYLLAAEMNTVEKIEKVIRISMETKT